MFADDRIGLGYGLMGLFQDDAKFVTFNGQAWILDETALTKHLKAIADAGANVVRLLPWGVWGSHKYGKKSQFQPYFLDTSRDKWDLSMFNTHYFPILKRVIEIINGLNMTVIFPLFDNCQFHGGYSKWSPWVSNTQGITTLYDPAADVYTKRWVSTMTLRFKDNDIIWSFGNEMNNAAFPAFAKRVIFPYIKARKLDFNRMTYGATMMKRKYLGNNQYDDTGYCPLDFVKKDVGVVFGEEAKLDMYREIHGCGGKSEGPERPFGADVDQALWGWGKNPIRKIFSDDGCYTGNSKCDKRDKGARPSAESWAKMATYILTNYPVTKGGRDRLINFEHLPGVYPPDTVCQTATIKAISVAYRARFGCWPKNWGKYGG